MQMMRHPEHLAPHVICWPATPAGFMEMTIDDGRRTLATEVIGPDYTDDEMQDSIQRLFAAFRRAN